MNAKEFKNELFDDLNNSELEIGEIIVNTFQRAEAYHKHKVEAITDKMIADEDYKRIYTGKEYFEDGAKWFKEQLLKQ
jgi:hypothetical protein